MSVIKFIDLGVPNAGDGDPLRDGGLDINDNFAALNNDKLEKAGYGGTAQDLYDLIIASGGNGVALIIDVTQTAHGFAVGQAVFIDSSVGVYGLAIATDEEGASVMGIVETVTDANNFTYRYGGVFTGAVYPVGTDLFLSNVTPGAIIAEPTYLIGEIRQYIGTMTDGGIMLNVDIGQEITSEGGGTATAWGGIIGTLANQTDLITYVENRSIFGGTSVAF